MSKLTARQAIQATARGAPVFGNDDVTLNDWSVLDAAGATDNAPFLVIIGSERFSARWPSNIETTWEIITFLLEAWDIDWPTTLEAFLASRQALVDAFNSGSARAPSGEYYDIGEIRGDGPIVEHTAGDYTYLMQEITFVTEEIS